MVIDVVDAAVLEEEWAVSAVGRGEVAADLTVAEVGKAPIGDRNKQAQR
jgi:hypothetical protein